MRLFYRSIALVLCIALSTSTSLYATSGRTPLRVENGVVASASLTASEVGVEILKQGGNAVDAAIATAFALAVTWPSAGNIGGGGFMVYHGEDGHATSFDFREKAPLAATETMYLGLDGKVVNNSNHIGMRAIGVPGTVAGLAYALEHWGTMKWWQLVDPALALADKGYVLNATQAASLEMGRERLLLNDEAKRVYLAADGSAPPMGTRRRYTDLAATLKLLKSVGPKAIYGGAIGQKIVDDLQRQGGVLTMEDLLSYHVTERAPVTGTYRGFEVVSMPPPSSGGVHLIQMLNMLEGWPLAAMGAGSAQGLHLMAEAMRRAYADRSEYLGDPGFVPVPVAALTSKDYAAALRSQINPDRATASATVKPGKLAPYESRQTTHFSVMDRDGNAVANTYTLNWSYGSGIVAKGTGILLNNEMDDFSAKPGEPNAFGLIGGEANAVQPGKKPLSSMTPTLLMKDNKVFLVTGSPGGSQIITTVLQTIVNVVDHGMNIQAATNAPRVHHQWWPDELLVEHTLNPDTVSLLRARGHTVTPTYPIGTTQTILYWDGLFQGAADPRRGGGKAVGL